MDAPHLAVENAAGQERPAAKEPVTNTTSSRLKVLYVAGFGRSGSTLLDNVLNELDGFVSVGELRYLWDRGLLEDRLSGTGTPFSQSPFWHGVLRRAYGDEAQVDAAHVVRLREQVHSRHVLLAGTRAGERVLARRAAPYAHHVARLYAAVQAETGCRVLIDSSKFPSHGFALEQIPGIALHVVHLVRDARAVSFSWMRRKAYDETGRQVIEQQSPLQSAWLWSTWNALVEARWAHSRFPYARVRYEDFVRDPEATTRMLLQLLQEPPGDLSFIEGQVVRLGANQAVSGNPSRFQQGAVHLRLDNEWEQRMKPHHKALVTLLARPLLNRHGYR